MSAEDLDNYETDAELALYKEYRDVIKLFTYVVETERRRYFEECKKGTAQKPFSVWGTLPAEFLQRGNGKESGALRVLPFGNDRKCAGA